MTKEQIVLFYSAVVVLMLIVFSILIYFKNKTIIALRLKIEELDDIYFDEIKALEDIVEKDKLIDNSEKEVKKDKDIDEQEVNDDEKN